MKSGLGMCKHVNVNLIGYSEKLQHDQNMRSRVKSAKEKNITELFAFLFRSLGEGYLHVTSGQCMLYNMY